MLSLKQVNHLTRSRDKFKLFLENLFLWIIQAITAFSSKNNRIDTHTHTHTTYCRFHVQTRTYLHNRISRHRTMAPVFISRDGASSEGRPRW